jgi:transcriptional/translational regulatory protein YebC/TACO1
VQEALLKAGIKLEVSEVRQLADPLVEVDAETGRKVLKLMDTLDDHDDVQAVYTDLHVTEEMHAE